MKVPFLNLSLQIQPLRAEIDEAMRKVVDSSAFICGKNVAAFEGAYAEAHNAPFFLGTSSGTDALHLALWGLGVGPGDGVIMPVNTFIATAEAVSLCGASPIFVDCDEFALLDVGLVEQLLADGVPGFTLRKVGPRVPARRITAIIPVHLYGQAVDMSAILDLAERYHLKVVEDACQAHLAQCRTGNGEEPYAGTLGEAGAFSFFPGKNLGAFGEAGGVAVRDPELFERMLLLRGHGSRERYVHELPGHNYRMEELQAAVLNVKLPHLAAWTARRQEVAVRYCQLLGDLEEIDLPKTRSGNRHVFHLFVVKVPRTDRDNLREYLAEKGIETGLHYPYPLHLTGAYAHLGYQRGDFPVAEEAADRMLSLPMCPTLTEEQIRHVCDSIKSFFAS